MQVTPEVACNLVRRVQECADQLAEFARTRGPLSIADSEILRGYLDGTLVDPSTMYRYRVRSLQVAAARVHRCLVTGEEILGQPLVSLFLRMEQVTEGISIVVDDLHQSYPDFMSKWNKTLDDLSAQADLEHAEFEDLERSQGSPEDLSVDEWKQWAEESPIWVGCAQMARDHLLVVGRSVSQQCLNPLRYAVETALALHVKEFEAPEYQPVVENFRELLEEQDDTRAALRIFVEETLEGLSAFVAGVDQEDPEAIRHLLSEADWTERPPFSLELEAIALIIRLLPLYVSQRNSRRSDYERAWEFLSSLHLSTADDGPIEEDDDEDEDDDDDD